MKKRITALYCLMILMLTGIVYRIYYIDASDYIKMAAQVQGKYTLNVATTRGSIYDRSFNNLVNSEYRYIAAVLPSPQTAGSLLQISSDENRSALLERLSDGSPFAMEMPDNRAYATGIDVFRVPERYGEYQFAPHLIGYLSDGDIGVAGIERAYDQQLTDTGGSIDVVYQTDAAGRFMQEGAVDVRRRNLETGGGVVLTLDQNIQRVTQQALAAGCAKGAAVVLDIQSGDILAMASQPVFDQNDIQASLDSTDAPFINRAISGYNIGSVFKVVVSAAALEQGLSSAYQHECEGAIDVDGQTFRCNNSAVHGLCDMERALEVSCNSYFISLAQQMDPQFLRSFAENLGLGQAVELAPGMSTQGGNLPTGQELENTAAYANFSFGQGSSLASPLQMAQAVAAIANAGQTRTPRLVLGLTEDGETFSQQGSAYSANKVMSESTARTVKNLMVKVVEEGSGRTATPLLGGAGGKTSSAQTGQLEDGREIVHAWFAGFFPADNPRYSIVVFVEDGQSGEKIAAPIFKQIVDGIARTG